MRRADGRGWPLQRVILGVVVLVLLLAIWSLWDYIWVMFLHSGAVETPAPG